MSKDLCTVSRTRFQATTVAPGRVRIKTAADRQLGEPNEALAGLEADELVAAGATRVREESNGEDLGHIVMLDPEGNEFCVA